MNEREKKKTYILLIATTVIWGIQPLCIKWLLADWSPVTITAMRYFCISAILFLLLRYRGETLVPPRDCWLLLLFMGFTGIGINNVLQFTGLQYSTVTNCTLIAAASPAITAFLAALFVRDRLNLFAWFGIAISFAGALLVVSHGSMQAVLHWELNYGDILFFLAQIAWTAYSILGLKVMKKISAMAATAWAGLTGAVVTTAYGVVTGTMEVASLGTPTILAFAYTVIFGGVMAMLFWNIGVKNAGPSLTSIFQNISPVVGMAGGAVFFGEMVGFRELSGALAIFAGVYLTTHSQELTAFILAHEGIKNE